MSIEKIDERINASVDWINMVRDIARRITTIGRSPKMNEYSKSELLGLLKSIGEIAEVILEDGTTISEGLIELKEIFRE